MRTPVLVCILAASWLASSARGASCTVAASSIGFGNYPSILNQSRDSNGTLDVHCTGTAGEHVNIAISVNYGGGSYSSRTLSSANSSLSYNLYVDANRTQVWGDGTGGTSVIQGSFDLDGTGSYNHTYDYFGRITAGQNAAKAGGYSDQMTVTMTY